MKIIISVNTVWNIYNFRLELIKSLISEGHEVIALAPKDDYVYNLEACGIKCYNIKLNSKGTNPLRDLGLIFQYHKLFNKIKPDIILSYTIKPNIFGNIAARILHIPTINNISGLGTLFIKTSFTTYIAKLLYRLSLAFSSHIFFQNIDDQQLFIETKLVKSNSASIIPGSGVDINKFSFKRTKNKGNSFLFVGRLITDKGVIEYLDAAVSILKTHPNKEFFLVGEMGYNNRTALSQELLDMYTKKYSQIKYLGKTDDIVSLLNSVDVMVLPSYREGLSKSLIEASAMSLPIVTTNVPGCRDVVEHEFNGFLCEVKSKKSLEKAICRLINLTEKERLEFGFNGREKIINEFSSIIVNKIYSDKIKMILNS